MAVYTYIAAPAAQTRGEIVRGTITADSPRTARDQLRAQGMMVREVVERRAADTPSALSRFFDARQAGHVTGLLQEMATLLSAGIPLLDALDTISRQHKGRFKQSILLLRDHVAAGGGLAAAMKLQPALFNALCVNIIEVGENAGTLDTALVRLVEFRQRSSRLKNRIVSTLMYPCIVAGVGVIVSIFLMTFVVPRVTGVLVESGRPLPMATVVVKSLSDALIAWWWALLATLAVVIALVRAILQSEKGGMLWHRMQLRIPLFGELIRKQAIARMALVMATLLKSDVAFVRALQIAQGTVRNRVLRRAMSACEDAVCAGRDIAAALEKTEAFPPLVVQMFAVGQASGRLDEMLENLAKDYDTQVDVASSRVTALLEPAMLILLAINVGFIAFATILPILEAGDVL